MCGIVGLYAKSDLIRNSLGEYVGAMLEQMGERGPDSAGVAFYSDSDAASKVTVQHDSAEQIESVANAVTESFSDAVLRRRGSHLVIESSSTPADMEAWVRNTFPDIRVMSAGERIEIYKEKGHPSDFVSNYALQEISGSHALAHTPVSYTHLTLPTILLV